jgi:hypothetical protein
VALRRRAMELNVEQLLGTKVRDGDGNVIGRIEEIRAERTDDACYVDSYLVGASAVVDLSEPKRPVLRVPRSSLHAPR